MDERNKLFQAAQTNDIATVECSLTQTVGWTALHLAARLPAIVTVLLAKGG